MDKTIAGLLGAMGTLAAAAPAPADAAPLPPIHQVMQAGAYADLLKPIPNAASLLPASDALLAEAEGAVVPVQYRDDHHHHHRTHRRPPPRRHHHHHHGALFLGDAPKPV